MNLILYFLFLLAYFAKGIVSLPISVRVGGVLAAFATVNAFTASRGLPSSSRNVHSISNVAFNYNVNAARVPQLNQLGESESVSDTGLFSFPRESSGFLEDRDDTSRLSKKERKAVSKAARKYRKSTLKFKRRFSNVTKSYPDCYPDANLLVALANSIDVGLFNPATGPTRYITPG
jgi:hypothetical protein